ncbi:MAG: TatD family hydrolase [Gemmatimonadaceae bacterium]
MRPLRFVDSHAHLADPAFNADVDAVLERARAAGARAVICIGESRPASTRESGTGSVNDRATLLAGRYPGFVHATAGVHPHDAAAFDRSADPDRIRALIAGGAVAVGECGLDYHYNNSPRDAQRLAFELQVALAREAALPIIVHTRDAEDDTRAIVAEAGEDGVAGVLHCFTGSIKLAGAALAAGWYISFSGIVTFRSWGNDDVVRLVPADRLLAESDSPYLAPVPRRGKRNEPSLVPLTIERMAAVRGESAELLARQTTDNACRLFGLADGAGA